MTEWPTELASSRPTLHKGEALDCNGDPVEAYGCTINGTFVVNPYTSVCGRFTVDPSETYGLTREEADAVVRANAERNLLAYAKGPQNQA